MEAEWLTLCLLAFPWKPGTPHLYDKAALPRLACTPKTMPRNSSSVRLAPSRRWRRSEAAETPPPEVSAGMRDLDRRDVSSIGAGREDVWMPAPAERLFVRR